MADQEFARPDSFPSNQFAARDLPTPRFTRPLDIRGGNSKPLRSIAWSCDGKRIATGTELKGIRIWDARTTIESSSSFPLPHQSKASPHTGHVSALAFSPVDPNILVSGCKSSPGGAAVVIWDVTNTYEPLATFKISGDVLHIAFHPSGRHIAVVCPRQTRDEVFFYWRVDDEVSGSKAKWALREDVAIGGPLIDSGVEEINSLRFSNSGKIVCAVSNDGSLNAWVYPEQLRPPPPAAHASPITSTPPPGLGLVPAPSSGSSFAPNSLAPGLSVNVGAAGANSQIATPVSNSPKVVADAGADAEGEADGEGNRIMESRGGSPERAETAGESEGGEKTSKDAEATAEGDVEMGSEDVKTMDVEMAESAPVAHSTSTKSPVEEKVKSEEAVVEPTTTTIITPSPEDKARAAKALAEAELERRKWKQLKRFRRQVCHSASLLSLSLDPHGRFLAVGGQDAMLSLLDTVNWICVRTFDVCTAAIRHSAFSPDGELIAIAGDDSFIAIVSVFTGSTITKIPVIGGSVNAIAWDNTKNWLAYSTSSKTMVVWFVVRQE